MQVLSVGIHADKIHSFHLGIYHMINGVFSGTSYPMTTMRAKLYWLIYFWHNFGY